jgi:citrate synthase
MTPTSPASLASPTLHPGLADVYLAETRTSRVDGEAGELTLGGFDVAEIAPRASFEEVAWLLLAGDLPSPDPLAAFRRALGDRRALAPTTLEVLRRAAERGLPPMAALRLAAASFDLAPVLPAEQVPGSWKGDAAGFAEALAILARMPSAVAAYERLRRGLEPVAPLADLSLAAAFLHQLSGDEPSPAAVRALDTYLSTVIDHGCNASTFTARVIVSTGADLLSAIVGAIGALSGPLHGGAPGPALDLVLEIGTPERAEEVLRARLAAGERLMGFGHRIYKVRDPRAEVLGQAAEQLFADGRAEGGAELYALFRHVEAVATRLLDEAKPGRRLRANVELYTALLLHGLGLPADLFSSVFAIGRTAGWLAHCREQRADAKLIRPRLHYVGERGRAYVTPGRSSSDRSAAA